MMTSSTDIYITCHILLEPIRWYKVDYTKAGQLVWGCGDGCGYAAGSCGGYIKKQEQQYIL